jgi:hypothetical protein
MMFKKKKFVRFVNEIPGVEIAHPVIHAKDYKFSWLSKLNKEVTTHNKTCPVSHTSSNTARCPGIVDLMHKGFIITAPFDFVIKTDGDKKDLEWHMNIDPSKFNKDIKGKYISFHPTRQLHDYTPARDDSSDLILKINTFWKLSASDDLQFLQMPIPYPEHNMFSACHGIIDSNKYNEVNLQLQWHKLNGEFLVKAGTPLCQLVPLTNEKINLKVEKMTADDVYANNAYSYFVMHEYKKDMSNWRKNVKSITNFLRNKN